MKVDNVTKVVSKLMEIASDKKAQGAASVVVGYTQRYAVKVHEEPANHGPGKSDKYLEKPTRQLSNSGELARIIGTNYKRTKDLETALTRGALRIQRESQDLVPVDTSALKASAYVALERDHDAKATAAFVKSDAVMAEELARRVREGNK